MKVAKELIYQQLLEILDKKIEGLKLSVASVKEARDQETKSSLGDKYETGRAMMQLELEKLETQLNNAVKQKKELAQINLKKDYQNVEFGSLVTTSEGNYFISIGIGKIESNHQTYYAISLGSPIGRVLFQKRAGHKIQFQEREFTILEIS